MINKYIYKCTKFTLMSCFYNYIMSIFFKLLILFALPLEILLDKSSNDDIKNIVTTSGYPIETHHVTTEDGYVLGIFRIPHGKNSTKINDRPILVSHGLLGTAENFILLGPEKSLAYVLADAGYDVWLINCRGTEHSRKHITLKPEQKEFWDFSWHEIGIFDLPAVIDYILHVTHKKNIFYVGYSQGGTIAFVMASEKPEYNKKIKLMTGLSPGAFYSSISNPFYQFILKNYKILQSLLESLHIYEFPPPFFSAKDVREAVKALCIESTVLKNTCRSLFFSVFDEKLDTFDKESFPTSMLNILATISIKQAVHYVQLINSGNFQKYDFGPEQNKKKYGTLSPPLYNLKNVQFPVVLFCGKSDSIVLENNTLQLGKELPNLVAYESIPLESFNHYDYILAKNAKELVFLKMLKLMENYENK